MKKIKWYPLVSVIIPTYKRSENLLQTLDSVCKQTYSKIEIIVVDDNGKGTECQMETEQRLETYIKSGKISYITHDINRNGSAARNTGFRCSKGEYVVFLDDDDELFPDYIKKGVTILSTTSDKIGACYCNSTIVSNGKNGIIKYDTNLAVEGNLCLGYLKGKYFFNTSAILFKRIAIDRLNGFDESFKRHQDYELMTRFFTIYEIKCSGESPLLFYDLTKVRTYVHSAEKDYILKRKFLTDLKPYLEKLEIYSEVSHWFWFNVMEASIQSKQFLYLSKAAILSLTYGFFTCEELFRLSKLVVKLLLGRL